MADIVFEMKIDFTKPEDYKINIGINKGKMLFKSIDNLYLKNISGNLKINKNDILYGKLTTKLYGNHINVELKLKENNDFIIESYGYTNIKEINDVWLKNDFLSNLNGGSIFKSKITIGKTTKIELHSNLKGISSNNPAPFFKESNSSVNFIFGLNLNNNNTFIHYDNHNLKLNFKDDKIDQVLFGFNKLTPKTNRQ